MTLAILSGQPAFPDRLPLVRPTIPDIPAVAARIESILSSGMLTNGPTVRTLEEAAADYLGVEHVVALASCTAGLMLTYQALDVRGPVVMPSFTFSASAHAVVWAGGRPRFADVLGSTMNLDPEAASALMDGAEALSATHVYGTPAEVEALQRLADAHGVPLVYDAAHALGSKRNGVACGNFGTAEIFSLSPTKVAVAGEGGLVATSDADLARKLRIGRDYGNPGNYDCEFTGINARMSELHAAVALACLDGLDERIAYRNELVRAFKAHTEGLPGVSYQELPDTDTSSYKDLTLVVDPDRFGLDAPTLTRVLAAEGIASRRYYHPPIHRQAAYAGQFDAQTEERLPVTARLTEQVITPPLYSHMTREQVLKVADVFVAAHEQAARIGQLNG